MTRLTLEILGGDLAVVRLPAGMDPPAWFDWSGGPIASVTRAAEETSIVMPDRLVPADARAERGWRAIKVRGPLDFALTGILHSILTPLAASGISVFTLSTYDTDYVLVRRADLTRAAAVLRAGFDVIGDA